MAWPMVWPKFKILRNPASVSSWPTIFALMAQQRSTTTCNSSGSSLSNFGKAGPELPRGQGAESVQVAQNQPRLMKGADEVLAGRNIHADFAADRAVHLG